MSADPRWRGKPVLVTGATGLLGGWICDALLCGGAKVVTLVRDTVPDSWLLRSGRIEEMSRARGDIRDLLEIERVLAEYEVEAIFHLAAQTLVGTAKRSPHGTFEANVRGTWNVLEAARRCETVSAVVVASSDKAYGPSEALPYREDHPLGGVGPYDASKAMTDMVCRSYAGSYGMPLVWLRCGNLYGPGDLNGSRLIPHLLRARLRGEAPVLRSSGRAERDWLYVEDAADAYLRAALRAGEDGVRGEAFNASTGEPASVLEVVGLIDELIGVSDPPCIIEGRDEEEGEIPRQSLDCGKILERLGWSASTGLREGLLRTIPWYRELLKAR